MSRYQRQRNMSAPKVKAVLKLSALLAAALISGLSACSKPPTTLIVNTVLECPAAPPLPNPSYLYLRMMDWNGNVLWSNESAPAEITAPADGDRYTFAVSPSNAQLSSPNNFYTFDAYLYSSTVVPPINPVNAAPGPDTELITQAAEPSAGIPVYKDAPHLTNNNFIVSGTERQIHLALQYIP